MHYWVNKYPGDKIVVLDALTYAGNRTNIGPLILEKQIEFICGDICNSVLVSQLFDKYRFDLVVHFAAESHVDRSIVAPDAFIRTNIQGTHVLLSSALKAWKGHLDGKRFHHVSTDEVYGDLEPQDPPFTEDTPYAPRSPYAASKASSDMLVKAYYTTYGMPVTISNCSNNYGPYQFPEKLIPLMLINALEGRKLPIYGDGSNVRDWLYVEDHCVAIDAICNRGLAGETYNVGGENEMINLDLVRNLCGALDDKFSKDKTLHHRFPNCPVVSGSRCETLITMVKDRPAHDRRYAINPLKVVRELGFHPTVDFAAGFINTLNWYLDNESWWRSVLSGEYRLWVERHYGSAITDTASQEI